MDALASSRWRRATCGSAGGTGVPSRPRARRRRARSGAGHPAGGDVSGPAAGGEPALGAGRWTDTGRTGPTRPSRNTLRRRRWSRPSDGRSGAGEPISRRRSAAASAGGVDLSAPPSAFSVSSPDVGTAEPAPRPRLASGRRTPDRIGRPQPARSPSPAPDQPAVLPSYVGTGTERPHARQHGPIGRYVRGDGSDGTVVLTDGDDIFVGGDGNEHVIGGAGDDYIDGAGGDDRLEGGTGDDTLLGGAVTTARGQCGRRPARRRHGDDCCRGCRRRHLQGGGGNDPERRPGHRPSRRRDGQRDPGPGRRTRRGDRAGAGFGRRRQ